MLTRIKVPALVPLLLGIVMFLVGAALPNLRPDAPWWVTSALFGLGVTLVSVEATLMISRAQQKAASLQRRRVTDWPTRPHKMKPYRGPDRRHES